METYINKKNWTAKDVEEVLLIGQEIVSLNTLIDPEQGEEEIEAYIKDDSPSPEEELIQNETREKLISYIDKTLSARDADIIKSRFGLYEIEPVTLEEIGQRYGLTRERVRQIEQRALRRLRVVFIQKNMKMEEV